MIINVIFKNYRSVKNEEEFSFVANSSKIKSQNLFQPIEGQHKLSLLKSCVIYGSNASGKTNLIRVLHTLKYFILHSGEIKVEDPIPEEFYDPFLLDEANKTQPIEISIDFVPLNKLRHRYTIKFDKNEIISEYLGVYETIRISRIFERVNSEEYVDFGIGMENKKEDKRVTKNNLYLSRFGNSTNEQLRNIWLYFNSMEVWNIVEDPHKESLHRKIQTFFADPNRETFRRRLSKLINVADTKINTITVDEREEEDFPVKDREELLRRYKYETYGLHSVYENKQIVGEAKFGFFNKESQGTNLMFAIGGLILEAFERPFPAVIALDEFDNSLHPDLVKFLIDLFHNPKVNKNNSQLICATHATQLLDKKIFRKDQIWFAEKNSYGVTEFFSVNDFKNVKNVRADMPFYKWYLTGKFGAIPNIKKFEFIAEYE